MHHFQVYLQVLVKPIVTLVSVDSSVRSMDDDDCFSNQDSDCSGDFMTMEWAKVSLLCPLYKMLRNFVLVVHHVFKFLGFLFALIGE